MKNVTLIVLLFALSATLSRAWWANHNDWGVVNGDGSYTSYTTWKVSGTHDFRSDWAGVIRDPGAYVILYPSAVEG